MDGTFNPHATGNPYHPDMAEMFARHRMSGMERPPHLSYSIDPQDLENQQRNGFLNLVNNILSARSGEDCSPDLKQQIKQLFPFLTDSSAVWIDVNVLVSPTPYQECPPHLQYMHYPPNANVVYQPQNMVPMNDHQLYQNYYLPQSSFNGFPSQMMGGISGQIDPMMDSSARHQFGQQFQMNHHSSQPNHMAHPADGVRVPAPQVQSFDRITSVQGPEIIEPNHQSRRPVFNNDFSFNNSFKKPEGSEIDRVKIVNKDLRQEEDAKKIEEIKVIASIPFQSTAGEKDKELPKQQLPISCSDDDDEDNEDSEEYSEAEEVDALQEGREGSQSEDGEEDGEDANELHNMGHHFESNVLKIQPPKLYQNLVKPNFSFNGQADETHNSLLQKRSLPSATYSTFKMSDGDQLKVKQRLVSGQIKKIKFFWRGTNYNYPYTFKRNYRNNLKDAEDKHFTEIVDLSKKVIQPTMNFENKF